MRDNDTEAQTLSLPANTNYEFLQTAKIWVQSGKLYLFKASLEQKQVNLNDFYGMPVMPETKIELINDKSYASFSYYDGSSMRLDGPGTYNYYPLGTKAEQYAVSLSAPNDWYYSKLSSFQNDTNSTILSLNLISPQKQADKEGPLITYGDKIRIPVYQKQIINLKSYIDDISGIDSVWIDADQTKDTDGDGDMKNDKDSLDSNSSYGIKKGNTIYDLNIGPFDTLFTKKITLFTKDGNGNISSKDLTLTVYPPVPNIESITGSIVSGRLDETLGDEPVDIFRLRNGVITRIESTKSNSGLTRTDGTFHLPTKDTNGIVLTESGNTIATINERTGKITLDDTSFHIAVV
ncbi:hypothetical protein GW830_02325 [bacterium]|nr:hypothetical protein [bacterium]